MTTPSSDPTDIVERINDALDDPFSYKHPLMREAADLIKTLREQRDETARTAWANRDAYLTELQALRSENITLRTERDALRKALGHVPFHADECRTCDSIAALAILDRDHPRQGEAK